MKKRLLVLFAKGFPYNLSEPFLDNEYPLYKNYFDKTVIITGCKKNEKPTRQITDPTIEIIPDHTLSKDAFSLIEALPWLLTDKFFYRETAALIFRKKFSFKKLYALLITALCGNHRALQAYRFIKKNPGYSVDVIYGYWLNIPAYAALRLNKKLGNKARTVSRVHGFDLYVERSRISYLPFQEQIYNNIDEIASISENGKKYLEDRFGDKGKVSVFRLGALDRNLRNPTGSREVFRIVSCARVIPLKRLTRIVDALKSVTNKEVVWTHIGDGEDFEKLKSYAAKELPENVKADFKGFVPNAKVYDIYAQTPFHVFVNVSETEGVPVSIMEAMSFGIPAAATAVGGTPELIDDKKNGFLLPADFTDADLTACITALMNMTDEQYNDMKIAARKKFEDSYSAVPNYTRFVEHISDRRK
ncbi:MAG: glycosyltransferase [Clostridia bacterium]|nr:glycosyltransferase [Clostridia bacterium]